MDVEAIKCKIIEDKNKKTTSYNRYPVRFLFMNMNNNTQEEIQEIVKSGNGELLDLSDYLMNKDEGWITKTKFFDVIRKQVSSTRDTYVLGFSELIRFYSRKDVESTVLSLFDIENSNVFNSENSKRRIIFVCFSMKDDVYRVLRNCFARKELLDPFLNPNHEFLSNNCEICLVSNEFSNHINKNKIISTVDWIGLWRSSKIIDFNNPIWCCSERLFSWHKKFSQDNAFQIDVICNAKQYLEKAYGVLFDVEYQDFEKKYWEQLCEEYEKNPISPEMNAIAESLLGINTKSISALAAKWFTSDSQFTKWFIKCYVVAYHPMSFLSDVFRTSNTDSKKKFITAIWKVGYQLSDSQKLEERICIIKEINKYVDSYIPEKEIYNIICEGVAQVLGTTISVDDNTYDFELKELSKRTGKKVEDMIQRLKEYYLRIFKPTFTGISNSEKDFVINLFVNNVLSQDEIEIVYPSLYSYLFGMGEEKIEGKLEWKNYLQAYRKSKIEGADNVYLSQYYSDGHANASNMYRMYYDLKHQEILVGGYVDNSDVYVLDGVGAEYTSLLIDLIEKNGYEITFCDYATCHLPSITEVNREYLSKTNIKEWFFDFDKQVIHGECYKKIVNSRKAFDMLENKIKEIILEAEGRRIIITSDHGSTARAKWTETKKKYNFDNADHEGRCCKISSGKEYENNQDYVIYEDESNMGNSYIISLNETSLYNRPKYEGHGGATVEEMLVPVIVADPKSCKKPIEYKIQKEKNEVSGLDRKIKFRIWPVIENDIYVYESNGTKHLPEREGELYVTTLSNGKEQDVFIKIENKDYIFHVINRAKKNMEGDDGFDD